MFHHLFSLNRPLFVLDLETTGVNTKEARIVEIAFQMWDWEGLKKEYSTLINPGISIPAEASGVNKITDEDVKEKPRFAQLAKNLAMGFSNCDFAGKNVRFDLRILAAEMARANVVWSYLDARVIDADRLEQIGEPRTLSHLYRKHLGKEPENAHQALADVQMTTEILVAQLQKYSTLPRTLDKLHHLQWPGWIDPDGKFKFDNGVPVCTFGKYSGKSMMNIPSDYWSWIISADFSADVKALAERAKRGEFPTCPTEESNA